MKKFISLAAAGTALAILLVAAADATPQTSTSLAATSNTPEGFSFKGNPLGMTLEQFKIANPTTPCFTFDDVAEPVKSQHNLEEAMLQEGIAQLHVKESQSATARDALHAAVRRAELAEGAVYVQKTVPWTVNFVNPTANEINCSSGDDDQDSLKVGSFKVSGVVYRFIEGRLYKVTILFPSGLIAPVRRAFTTKYGAFTILATDEYQNGLGACWSGANFAWTNGPQSIRLHEGSNNGPGQEFEAGSGSVTYEDRSLEPVPGKTPTNF
jgi:hypothetical protein